MYVYKACDCLSHELPIAKVAAYGLTENSLTMIQHYQSKRKQEVNRA